MLGQTRAWVASPGHALAMGGLDDAAEAEATKAQSMTVVAVFDQHRPLGLVALRDEPRADAAEAMAQLRALDVGAVMLTGDN
ncbi:ATPase, P-type (transporting), HAD superfamily, subfamily IC, partial [Paracoccus pantotrophus]